MRWLRVAYSMTAGGVVEAGGSAFARLVQAAGPTHSNGVLGRILCRRHKPFEFAMARAHTPDQYVQALRRFHVPAAFMIGSMTARQCGHSGLLRYQRRGNFSSV